jgi:hypothetical protein
VRMLLRRMPSGVNVSSGLVVAGREGVVKY